MPSPDPSLWPGAEFATLRARLLKIAARITETASRVRIAFAASCPEPGFAVIGHIEDLRGNVTRGFCPFSKISRRGILPKVRHTTIDILIEIIVMTR